LNLAWSGKGCIVRGSGAPVAGQALQGFPGFVMMLSLVENDADSSSCGSFIEVCLNGTT
jgi:hypothetical protein